jgi:murein DD-endopeptidase MepM/ murein hydrolase activator NlpD/Rod binding domain-containing protein
MSTDHIGPIQPATPSTNTDRTSRAQQRAELAAMAAEFESMLLVNMLRDMRTSGRWSSGGESGETLGADTFDSTFDLELARYLAKARGLGLSQQLMRAFDGMAADSRSGDTLTPSTTTPGTSTTASNTAYTGRTGWNGMRLDPPAPGNSGAQWGGFNVDRALAGGDDNSIKDGFYRWTYGLAFNPAGKSKEEIGQFLRDNVTSAREYGVNILDVRGDQILVETAENGPEWVDIVAGAGSSNPADVKWQWMCQSDFGVPTGGGALGQALASLRSMPGGNELARTVLADSREVGDALMARLQTAVADARAGRTPTTTTPIVPRTATSDPPPAAPDAPTTAAEVLRTPSGQVTSAYGWRQDPISGATRFHRGVDLRATAGDQVTTTGAGRVVFSGHDGAYGTTVIVEHGNGLSTRYAHLLSTLVNLGDEVQDGQAIGLAGQSGRATGPHVHYEVMASGHTLDPLR